MRVLVVHAHPDPDGFEAAIFDRALLGLERGGHEVRAIALYDDGTNFEARMSAAEREAYSTEEPILDEVVRDYANLVLWAEALVFVYPTWWFGLPAVLKGFLDRVLVPGVAFRIDPRTDKVKPALTNVRRLVGISTYTTSRLRTRVGNDAGRRTIRRTLRLVCHRFARSSWVPLYDSDSATEEERNEFLARVELEMTGL